MHLFRDCRGYVLPYVVFLISVMIMPLMILTSEIVRAMYVDIHLQAAADAACGAAVQAVDVPHFIQTGELLVVINIGRTYAQREFDSTVADHGLKNYNPSLSSVNLLTDTVVACEAVAQMQWLLPGIPVLIINASSTAEAQANL